MENAVHTVSLVKRVSLHELFTVLNVSSIFYRGLPKSRTVQKDFTSNDFWEFFYVDRGEISIELKDETVSLSAGEAILYAPYSIHRLTGSVADSVNVISLSFDCPRLDPEFFSNKVFPFNALEKNILSKIVKIGNLYFERYSNDPFGEKGIKLREDAPNFAAPFVKASIEYLLLLLYSDNPLENIETKTSKLNLSPPISKVVDYMHQNVYKKLSLDDFAAVANMSSSQFRMQFKKELQQSVIDFFNDLRVEQAKILIRESIYSLDEVALTLNYSSSSYFSRQFKQKTNMTPTEYSRLVNQIFSYDGEKI